MGRPTAERSVNTLLTARRVSVAATLCAAVLVPSANEARAQSLTDLFRDLFRNSAKDSELGNGLQSLSIFGVTPGVSTAVFNVEHQPGSDLRIETFKLPLFYEFAPVAADVRPYTEFTLSYVRANETEDFNFLGVGPQTKLDVEFDTYSVLGGIGATVPVLKDIRVRPILLAGYSRITTDGDFDGPFADDLNEASEDLITDATINSLVLGGALQALYERRLAGGFDVSANVRYNHFYDHAFAASDGVLETSGNFGVLTSRAEISGPTPLTLFGRPVRWMTYAANTYLPSEQEDSGLGFDFFFEIGGGAGLFGLDGVGGIDGVSLTSSLIVGADVDGWTVGLSLAF